MQVSSGKKQGLEGEAACVVLESDFQIRVGKLLKKAFICCIMVRDGAFTLPHDEIFACFSFSEVGREAVGEAKRRMSMIFSAACLTASTKVRTGFAKRCATNQRFGARLRFEEL